LYFTVPQTPLGLQATIETHNPFYVNSDAVLTTQCSHGVDPYMYIYFLPVQQINIIATRASSKLQPQYFQPFDEYIKSITTIPANIHSLSIKPTFLWSKSHTSMAKPLVSQYKLQFIEPTLVMNSTTLMACKIDCRTCVPSHSMLDALVRIRIGKSPFMRM
jgi:hypothetical protein